MKFFGIFLIVVFIGILIYTGVTISNHGLNLLPIFLGDMKEMAWPGQFNFDFMTFLALSALWTAWRNKFSAKGLCLAVVAFFGGMLFLSAYLFYLTFKSDGSVVHVMIGDRADGAT
ncbi:MAG: hypothetical protein ABJO36_13495 [Litorimonas sp.]